MKMMNHYDAHPSDFWELLKPRVMSLVIFTAFCGMMLAPGHIHPLLGATSILCIAVGAGASGCLNMYCEIHRDTAMVRTQSRPLPSGRINPNAALAFGVILSLLSVAVLGLVSIYTLSKAAHSAKHSHWRGSRRPPPCYWLGMCHRTCRLARLDIVPHHFFVDTRAFLGTLS